ncbi:hypothetical protein FPQ18DRAFT_17090, partial [Pyronema domesticum]
ESFFFTSVAGCRWVQLFVRRAVVGQHLYQPALSHTSSRLLPPSSTYSHKDTHTRFSRTSNTSSTTQHYRLTKINMRFESIVLVAAIGFAAAQSGSSSAPVSSPVVSEPSSAPISAPIIPTVAPAPSSNITRSSGSIMPVSSTMMTVPGTGTPSNMTATSTAVKTESASSTDNSSPTSSAPSAVTSTKPNAGNIVNTNSFGALVLAAGVMIVGRLI